MPKNSRQINQCDKNKLDDSPPKDVEERKYSLRRERILLEGRRSPLIVNMSSLIHLGKHVQIHYSGMPELKLMPHIMKNFQPEIPAVEKDHLFAGMAYYLHRSMEYTIDSTMRRKSYRQSRSEMERISSLLFECVQASEALPSQDHWMVWACFRDIIKDVHSDPKLEEDRNIALLRSLGRTNSSSRVFLHEFLRTWAQAARVAAFNLDVDPGRSRIPEDVERAVEATGCLWLAVTNRQPNTSNKKGSFSDFAQALAPLLVEGCTPSQVTTAIRQLVRLIQQRPYYIEFEPFSPG